MHIVIHTCHTYIYTYICTCIRTYINTYIHIIIHILIIRCGICLDCWMFPLHRDLYGRGVDQPFMFINSFEFQWAENVSSMMKLVKPVDETGMFIEWNINIIYSYIITIGISKCFLVTLK